MTTKTAIDPDTRRATDLFVERVSARFDTGGAILFGSRARGDHRPDSDADVAVLLRGPRQPFVATMGEMDDIAFDILLETGVRVTPLPIWEDEWAAPDDYSNPRLLRAIDAEGVRLRREVSKSF